MMNENYNTPNSGCCGRPFPTAPENKCNYNDCCMNEYAYKQKACIRNKQPDCESQAVIPSITVETVDGITNLANCLVHVMENNTTYYVDDKHRILITWAGPVNIPGYDMDGNPNNYKNQIVTDVEVETAVIYDNHGKGYIFGITPENLQQAVNDKLDEMATDGTLENLIAEYIEDVVFGFDTVADMKTSTVLGDGSYARTLGYHAKNDRGSALYRIRSKTGGDNVDEMFLVAMTSDNTLVAELITETTISPEQIGCVNDGTDDDAVYIQKCIDFSKANGVKVNFGHGVYYVKTGINLPLEYDIDFQGITLRAIANPSATKGMVNSESTWNIHNGLVSNLNLDQNNIANKGIYVRRSWRRQYSHINILNTPSGGYGIYLDGTGGGSGGNQFDTITGSGNYRNSTFIYVGVNDCVFSHVDYQQYTVGIETNAFVRLFDIHGYVATDSQFPEDWYTGSIFIKIDSSGHILADELYPDTHNFSFYNYSVLPSQVGKVFFTFNENTSQGSNTSVMFKAVDDNVSLYYRWIVNDVMLAISDNVSFELVKNSSNGLNTFLKINNIEASATVNVEVPPTYAYPLIGAENFTKLGCYKDFAIAVGTSPIASKVDPRPIFKLGHQSGKKLIDGYYSFKGTNPDDNSIYDGLVQVVDNRAIVMPNANQGAGFGFTIVLPVEEVSMAAP